MTQLQMRDGYYVRGEYFAFRRAQAYAKARRFADENYVSIIVELRLDGSITKEEVLPMPATLVRP